MPGIYAEKATHALGVTQMGGREIRDAYTRTRKSYVGFRGREAAAYVAFRDYRSLVAFKFFTDAVNEHSKEMRTLPQAVADALDNDDFIDVDTAALREFSPEVMQYKKYDQHDHPKVRPLASEIKAVGEREVPIKLYANKLLTLDEIDALTHVTEERKEFFKQNPGAQAVVIAEEDAQFETALVDAFAHSTHFATRRLSVNQVELDAAILGALCRQYSKVASSEVVPADIVDRFTRYNRVIEKAGLVSAGEDGYKFSALG